MSYQDLLNDFEKLKLHHKELKEAYGKACGTKRSLQKRVASLEAEQREVPRIPHLCLCIRRAVCVLALSSGMARQTPVSSCKGLPGLFAHSCPTSLPTLPIALPC